MSSESSATGVSDDESSDGAAVAPGKPAGRRKLMIIAGVAAILLLAGGGAAAYVCGLFGSSEETGAAAEAGNSVPTFYPLPALVVTLNTGDRKTRYLKAQVSLELARAQDQALIEQLTPRIIDYCQIYLRELRPDELRGSAAVVRMREELLKRITAAVAPAVVREVLFVDLMVE